MSFRIEYLTETTEEGSVCYTLLSNKKTIEAAEQEAFDKAEAGKVHGATGFQIRHVNAVDRVVAIANFGDQLPN